jgi:predicted transposase/invertase (TIGR01784 family)
MKQPLVHTPHDKLFRSALQYPKVAREFLGLFLPTDMKKRLDFKSLTCCPATFIDEQLKLSQADVLFKCKLSNQESYIYLLTEHESKADPLIAFWLMKYMVNIWDYHIKEGGKKSLPLPAIFPLVFYTGEEEYTGKRELWQLFGERSNLMKKLLQSPFHLIEAGKLPEEELTSHAYAGTMGFLLRQYFRKHIEQEMVKIVGNLNYLEQQEQHRYVVDLVQYIFGIAEGHQHRESLLETIQDTMTPTLEKTMASLAENLRMDGKQEGLREGLQEGLQKGQRKERLETAKKMLALGCDPALIMKVMPLNKQDIRKLQQREPLLDPSLA